MKVIHLQRDQPIKRPTKKELDVADATFLANRILARSQKQALKFDSKFEAYFEAQGTM